MSQRVYDQHQKVCPLDVMLTRFTDQDLRGGYIKRVVCLVVRDRIDNMHNKINHRRTKRLSYAHAGTLVVSGIL